MRNEVVLLVMTDGRLECLKHAIASAREHLKGPITHRLIHDDSGDDAYRQQLSELFPDFEIIHGGDRQGFGGAIRSAWSHVRGLQQGFLFHLEDDFLFNEDIFLDQMISVLDQRPHLVQLALRRQPWNDQEKAAGGIVEMNPSSYEDCTDGVHDWLEHRNFFTTNPCLYRRSLCERGWPSGENSEGRFGISLCEDPEVRFGYWGARSSGEKVRHIGDVRVGTGY